MSRLLWLRALISPWAPTTSHATILSESLTVKGFSGEGRGYLLIGYGGSEAAGGGVMGAPQVVDGPASQTTGS